MENHLRPHVLSMKICSCEDCPRRLKKKLLKMPGVDSVDIDTENNRVYVVGEIDATTLLDKVTKIGKGREVKLLSDEKQQHRDHVDQKHRNHTRKEGRGSNFTASENEKPHKNYYREDERQKSKKKVEEEQKHICEAYEPPKVDSRVCRDFHCKMHPRGRSIVDKVPVESTSPFFGMGGFPFYSGYNPYGGSYQYPGGHGGRYGQEPLQYGGYGWPPQQSRNPYLFQ